MLSYRSEMINDIFHSIFDYSSAEIGNVQTSSNKEMRLRTCHIQFSKSVFVMFANQECSVMLLYTLLCTVVCC